MYKDWFRIVVIGVMVSMIFVIEAYAGILLGVSAMAIYLAILIQGAGSSFAVAAKDPTYHHHCVGVLYAGTLSIAGFVLLTNVDIGAAVLSFLCLFVALATYAVRRARFRRRAIHTVMDR